MIFSPEGPETHMFSSLPRQFGRYLITRKLAEGGMGAVYLAEDASLRRQVALKVPKFSSRSKEVSERFLREARAAAQLRHANICPVYDVGEEEGVHYLTMAYIKGKPLSELIAAGRPLSQRAIALAVRRLALALQEAHEWDVIHRDLKPSNVMVDQRGHPILTDFGLARVAATQTDLRLSYTGMPMGTPLYMSPEQAAGDLKSIGPATDIYGLGTILYELLTGRPPFDGSDWHDLLDQIKHRDPDPPSRFRPDIDPALEAVCRRALAKSPDDRFGTMVEMAQALAAYLTAIGLSSRGAAAAGAAELQAAGEAAQEQTLIVRPLPPTGELAESPQAVPRGLRRWRTPGALSVRRPGRRRWIVAAAGVASLLLGGVALFTTLPDSSIAGNAGASLSPIANRSPDHDETGPSAESERVVRPQNESVAALSSAIAGRNANPPGSHALAFDGRRTLVTVPTLRYDGSHPITFEATVKLNQAPTHTTILADTEQAGFGFWALGLNVHDGSRYVNASMAFPPAVNEWVHVAGVFDRKQVSVFLNGKRQASTPFEGRYNRSPLALMIGANPSWNNRPTDKFDGLMRQIRISNIARYTGDYEPEEILGGDVNTIALYCFNEGEGSILYNSAGDLHHGIISAPRWVKLDEP